MAGPMAGTAGSITSTSGHYPGDRHPLCGLRLWEMEAYMAVTAVRLTGRGTPQAIFGLLYGYALAALAADAWALTRRDV